MGHTHNFSGSVFREPFVPGVKTGQLHKSCELLTILKWIVLTYSVKSISLEEVSFLGDDTSSCRSKNLSLLAKAAHLMKPHRSGSSSQVFRCSPSPVNI